MKTKARSSVAPYLRELLLNRDRVPTFDEYPFSLPVVRHMKAVKLHPKVTFIIGENGSGKSTLLEALAVVCGLNAEGGSRNFNFSTRASHSVLVDYITAVREPSRPRDAYFFRAESYFNVATEIERLDEDPDGGGPPIIDSYGGVSLHEQSHGESFFSTFLHRFGGSGLYILDEPEAALSPMRQFAMLSRLHQLVKLQSQFVIATHSPILMSYPDAVILEITDKGLRKSSLEETEHFKLSQAFFADPRRMLEMLMEVS